MKVRFFQITWKSICFLLLISFGCSKSNKLCMEGDLGCLEIIISNHDKNGLLAIKSQKIDGESHYYLETGASAWDGIEYIVNEKCDTICNFGGKRIDGWPPCYQNYDFNKWEVFWKK